MITQGTYDGYDYDRMIVRFSLLDDDVVVPCSVSTAAMDDLESCCAASTFAKSLDPRDDQIGCLQRPMELS